MIWEGTVKGRGVVVESKSDRAEGLSVLVVGERQQLWEYETGTNLKWLIEWRDIGGDLVPYYIPESELLYRVIMRIPRAANVAFEVKQDPELYEFLREYRMIREACDLARAQEPKIEGPKVRHLVQRLANAFRKVRA